MRSLRTGTIPATPAPRPKPNRRARRARNAPALDVRSYLCQLTGVHLTRIDGVDEHTALTFVSEVGLDMSRWETVKHFASWLGLCPNHRVTGGTVINSRTTPSANRAAAAFRLAAYGLSRSDSALGAFLRRKRAQPGL